MRYIWMEFDPKLRNLVFQDLFSEFVFWKHFRMIVSNR